LKGILRSPDSAKTYIFDEVDAGIGGATAEVVGQKLKTLSQNAQVICITHLPQIAACADAHYQIAKKEKKERVITQVRRLEGEEREEEIARMLAGVKVTEKARIHARELIGQLGETIRK
jgi:DNA repair protein RecN (Recombination protein N)